MPFNQKASDDQLLSAYAELASVWKVGKRFGMGGQSVHERLVKLGANTPRNIFTETDEDRLRKEYWIAAEAGKLAELASSMGRTKPFICRQARALGLTIGNRKRTYNAVWKYVKEDDARIIFEKFKKSTLPMGKYCLRRGYDDLGFARCMQQFFSDEWDHVLELKVKNKSPYSIGRRFEYKIRDHLRLLGYFAMRSPASRGPFDVIAVRAGTVAMIQCKRSGAMGVEEWNILFDLATSCGAVPVLASAPSGLRQKYLKMLARKSGSNRDRQPVEVWDPSL